MSCRDSYCPQHHRPRQRGRMSDPGHRPLRDERSDRGNVAHVAGYQTRSGWQASPLKIVLKGAACSPSVGTGYLRVYHPRFRFRRLPRRILCIRRYSCRTWPCSIPSRLATNAHCARVCPRSLMAAPFPRAATRRSAPKSPEIPTPKSRPRVFSVSGRSDGIVRQRRTPWLETPRPQTRGLSRR